MSLSCAREICVNASAYITFGSNVYVIFLVRAFWKQVQIFYSLILNKNSFQLLSDPVWLKVV